MKKLLFQKQYREFFMPGDVGKQDDKKAKELVDLGYATYMDVEKAAPMNKEVATSKKTPTCEKCGRGFASERGVQMHKRRSH